jgi:hypothetical protein
MAETKLSPLVNCYLEAWIGNATWHTFHHTDKTRFYRFVKAAIRYSRTSITGDDLKELLIQRFSGKFNKTYLINRVEYFASLFDDLYDFAKAEFIFPDELVEKKNISRYYHELTIRVNFDESVIELKMSHEWGIDWKNQLAQMEKRA